MRQPVAPWKSMLSRCVSFAAVVASYAMLIFGLLLVLIVVEWQGGAASTFRYVGF